MKYVLVQNTGKNFYTHKERREIPDFRIYNDLAILTDNSIADEWIQRVNGVEITKKEALAKLEDQFNLGKTNNVRRLQQELSDEQIRIFDSSNYDLGTI